MRSDRLVVVSCLRVLLVTLVVAVAASAPGAALGQGGGAGVGPSAPVVTAPPSPALRSAVRVLNRGMRKVGVYSGAYVVDLTNGQVLYSHRANTGRLPASVEKLYTTTTALQRFGPDATLTTSLLGTGSLHDGTYAGTVYLRGGGDPTFGSASFDRAGYGTGATIQQLVANLVTSTGIRVLRGPIVADETMFDADRGTPATGNRPSVEVEGQLSALSFDRGWSNPYGTRYFRHPAQQAGRELIAALRAAGVRVARRTPVRAGTT
ncbi:MAG: D-alanyl-D-alanine carboxypeptidase, partial [Solirubrobacteraceae bacterium]